jgi:C-terminal processing protease CtpA/Prc
VILMDDYCRGATDILLAACKGRARITIAGTASAGTGDGAVSFELVHSELLIEVSPLVSFLPDGQRLGLQAIQPEIITLPEPEFFVAGGRDAVLERAVKYLKLRPQR